MVAANKCCVFLTSSWTSFQTQCQSREKRWNLVLFSRVWFYFGGFSPLVGKSSPVRLPLTNKLMKSADAKKRLPESCLRSSAWKSKMSSWVLVAKLHAAMKIRRVALVTQLVFSGFSSPAKIFRFQSLEYYRIWRVARFLALSLQTAQHSGQTNRRWTDSTVSPFALAANTLRLTGRTCGEQFAQCAVAWRRGSWIKTRFAVTSFFLPLRFCRQKRLPAFRFQVSDPCIGCGWFSKCLVATVFILELSAHFFTRARFCPSKQATPFALPTSQPSSIHLQKVEFVIVFCSSTFIYGFAPPSSRTSPVTFRRQSQGLTSK